jgi:hypothetical protein
MVAGFVATFALAASLTVALADDETPDPTVEASPAATADPDLQAPTLPSPANGGGNGACWLSPSGGGNEASPVAGLQAASTLPSPASGGWKQPSVTVGTAAQAKEPSVLDRVQTVVMAPVLQTAVAGHASVIAFFQPRPWLVAAFLGLMIAIIAMLAAGFREKRQLARI